jgi:hypothetical protein
VVHTFTGGQDAGTSTAAFVGLELAALTFGQAVTGAFKK